jgi:hypothetical protein
LKIPATFRRFNDRPLHRQNDTPSFLEDIGILFIDDDIKSFSCRIANINVHQFHPEGRTIPVPKMTDPISLSSSIIVYKVGVSTELSMGRFVTTQAHPPKPWYKPEEEEEVAEEGEEED